MARRKTEPALPDGEATSPAIAAIDPRQVAAANLTSLPGEDDPRDGSDRPDPVPEWGPKDVSNVVDPSDPMTLTGHDAAPGESGA